MVAKRLAKEDKADAKPVKRARKAVAPAATTRQAYAQATVAEEYRVHDVTGGDLYYVPGVLEKDESNRLHDELLNELAWYRPQLKVYGKTVTQSRKIAAYATEPGLKLKYSGAEVDMQYDYPASLAAIQKRVEKEVGTTFNHCMANLYEDGTVYIGRHRDNAENKVIASLSLGAERKFILTAAPARGQPAPTPSTISWPLENGSLVVMQGDTQKHWKHEIPKEKGKSSRISLTFRQLVY